MGRDGPACCVPGSGAKSTLLVPPPREAADIEDAEAWLRCMGEEFEADEVALGAVLDACAAAGQPAAAARCLSRMRTARLQPRALHYNTLLKAHAQVGDAKGAEGVLRRMTSAEAAPDASSYNTVLNACARAGRAEAAERWLQQMRAAALRPCATSFNSVANAYARAGRIEDREGFFSTGVVCIFASRGRDARDHVPEPSLMLRTGRA